MFDATTPALVCAAEHDPIAAIVMHSSPADVEAVMVDGVWRKKDNRLLSVHVEEDVREITKRDTLQWADVAKALVETRKIIQKKTEKIDLKEARAHLIAAYHIDENLIVEKV
jgi:hypothetical protein